MTDTAHETEAVSEAGEIEELHLKIEALSDLIKFDTLADLMNELQCYKVETLADLWDVSKRTIEKLIYDGELDSHKVAFNRRIRRQDALAYLERQRVRQTVCH